MNKAELIKELESRLGSRKAASEALTAVVDVVIREVAKGGSVAITGFGTFEQAARAARTGRNPRTGAAVKIKKTVVPKFRAGSPGERRAHVRSGEGSSCGQAITAAATRWCSIS